MEMNGLFLYRIIILQVFWFYLKRELKYISSKQIFNIRKLTYKRHLAPFRKRKKWVGEVWMVGRWGTVDYSFHFRDKFLQIFFGKVEIFIKFLENRAGIPKN